MIDTSIITQVNKVNLDLPDRCFKKSQLYTVDKRHDEKSIEKIKNEGKGQRAPGEHKEREKNQTKQNSRKTHQIDGYFPVDKRNNS